MRDQLATASPPPAERPGERARPEKGWRGRSDFGSLGGVSSGIADVFPSARLASLGAADLSDADRRGADVRGADLRETDLGIPDLTDCLRRPSRPERAWDRRAGDDARLAKSAGAG